jgi:uncharacterized protein (DUF1800 family)
MKAVKWTTWSMLTSLALAGGLVWGRQAAQAEPRRPALRLPWREAGLSQRQAAAHLLNRFAFGARPGEIDQVVAAGLDVWVERQIAADLPDPNLDARLRDLPALALSEADMVRIYRNPPQVLAEAQKEGVISKQEVAAAKADKGFRNLYGNGKANGVADANAPEFEHPELRAKLLAFARERGYRPERELLAQLYAQKLFRAAESQNQLREVMTDFWFNHFNVSQTNGRARPYLLAYERDAIRPNALGTARGLLEATARHPAMLYYLDNAESTAAPNAPTLLGDEMQAMRAARPGFRGPYGGARRPGVGAPNRPNPPKQARGLNENYARELMELHSLGVDGGYTQRDVIEVARAFTGWTVLPSGPAREAAEKRLEKARQFGGLGFRLDGDFLFRSDMHDSAPKQILGRQLPAGRGIEDGEEVLDLLARHPSTARHLSTQLAARFVSDRPPQALVDRLTATYDRSGGNVREMLRTLVQSPEFWSRDAVGAKVKSPFELAVSAVRAAGAHVEDPRQLLGWIGRMGQPLYAYQAPTGYPDRADAWVNTGSLLNRMNFGLQFAAQRIAGVEMDLPSLHEGPEPESRIEALRTYASLLLPGRDLGSTIKLLTPMVSDPEVAHRVDAAAPKESAPAAQAGREVELDDEMAAGAGITAGGRGAGGPGGRAGAAGPPGGAGGAAAAPVRFPGQGDGRQRRGELVRPFQPQHPPTPIEEVVGVILGSPEFQRR